MADLPPRAVVLGCAGPVLEDEEAAFFAEANPLGFILFERNCADPAQVRGLVRALRDSVGRPDAPILIDQEGGRVERLKPPHWRHAPAAAEFAHLAAEDLERGETAARLNMRLIAAELYDLGITVNCAPVLDIPVVSADPIIGDRALGAHPATVAALGRAVCNGLTAGGITPVIKHLPGHGRAEVDSHKSLPIVDAPRQELEAIDFVPFRMVADCPWGMTAHVVYAAIDPAHPATLSPTVIGEVIRGQIGFDGVLISDDIGMRALSGPLPERAEAALAAGCDVVLHCSGDMVEMSALVPAVPPLTAAAEQRLTRAFMTIGAPTEIDRRAVFGHLVALVPEARCA